VLNANTVIAAGETALANAFITTVLQGGNLGKNFLGALAGEGVTIAGARLANNISGSSFAGGKITKVGLHAMLGGLLSMAQGGDFATGALAAGGDEALVEAVASVVAPNTLSGTATPEQQKAESAKLLGVSQLIGVLAAAATGGKLNVGAAVAANATEYNFLGPVSQARRDADREAMKNGTATAEQKAEFVSAWQNDQRSDYLFDKLHNNQTLTNAEREELNNDFKSYLDEMAGQVGIQAAQDALSGLQQNGVYKTYDYPFAGTADQKAAWTAANSQTVKDFFQTQVRAASEDEHLYNGIGHSAQIATAQEDDARIGQLAFLLEEEMAIKIAIAAKVFADGVGAAEGALLSGVKATGGAAGKVDDLASTGTPVRPTPQKSEIDVGADLGAGARPQVSYKNGQEVPYGTSGSVRPDWCVGNVCSVEVKNYNIAKNQSGLISNVSKQALQRAENLPQGMQQQVVIDIRGQAVTPVQRAQIVRGIVDKSNGAISPSSIRFKAE
jgi:hypothetical protein